jgi:methylmalonyl-CoA mutase, N-terminal domain
MTNPTTMRVGGVQVGVQTPARTYPSPVATRPTQHPKPAASEDERSQQQAEAVEEDLHRFIAPVVGADDGRRFTDSGIEVERVYDRDEVGPGLEERLGEPGSYPFTRGIHPGMYRDRLWTMRQYAGYATAEETNRRYRYLIEHGSTGLSMAFDLPTQLGRDSDDPLCLGEVGRTGVAIDTIEDMRICFDQIPLDEVSTSMTINAPAAILLLLYELVGEEQGIAPEELRGTVQNDVLKEYVARGNYIFPPEATMRLTTDIFEYCRKHVPKWNTISISGYHIREKGCSAVQEVAFTLANAVAYVSAALDRGLAVDDFAPRLAFFFNCHNNVFQEIAKFRAVRRMWAKIMRERFGAEDPRSQTIRFHTQTGGVTLQAQQPEVNIIRVALQGFAAVTGGTQSLHTNGFDEALALPTERSARIALRTQQVIAHESGAADTVDPFAGSYFIEALTDEIESRAWDLIDKVEQLGGSVEALEFIQREIEESAASYHERYRTGQDIVVGVNKFVTDQIDDVEILKVDPESEQRQLERLRRFKEDRDAAAVESRLRDLRESAAGDGNLLYQIKDALRDGASIGEVCGAMRDVFGEYRGGAFF